MELENKRIYVRKQGITRIAYFDFIKEEEHNALTCNFSQGGLLFRTNEKIFQGSEIEIQYIESIDKGLLENLRRGCAQVIWCDEIAPTDYFNYGIGVRYIIYECNLCGINILKMRHYKKTASRACLCDKCYRHFKSLPDDNLKHSIEDIILGNVV